MGFKQTKNADIPLAITFLINLDCFYSKHLKKNWVVYTIPKE